LLQGSPAFLREAVLKATEDADVMGVPPLKPATKHEEESVYCGEEAEIGSQMVIAVLAVAHGGELIEMNAATTSRDQKVGEPIVVDDLASAIDSHEESAGGMVKDHGVATGNILGEGVLKTRRPRIIGGEADGLVVYINHASATAIEAWEVRRDCSQEGNGSLQFIAFPDVILIGVGVKVGLDVCMRDQGEEVGDESLLGTAMDGQALFSPYGLIL
jgi:hypothetical protein